MVVPGSIPNMMRSFAKSFSLKLICYTEIHKEDLKDQEVIESYFYYTEIHEEPQSYLSLCASLLSLCEIH